nr:zincin-like metallopeptidase domain-containing protein [Sphingomonas formosensis]
MSSSGRQDIYASVTARIIAALEEGRLPWVRPWQDGPCDPGLPRNALSRRPYSGINILILWGALFDYGWPTQCWLTFRQALEAGGTVRRGERGTTVVYADRFVPKAERDGERGSDPTSSDGEPRAISFLKRFTVFNVAQCEGLSRVVAAPPAPLARTEIVPLADAVIAASGVAVAIGGNEACYDPAADRVQLPPQGAFPDALDWYRTGLHELTHATGHGARLGRPLDSPFGSAGYAREELIAEMGAAFLSAALGLEPTVRHADYIGAWLAVLRADNRAIFRAASAASKAADWLLACPASRQEAGR